MVDTEEERKEKRKKHNRRYYLNNTELQKQRAAAWAEKNPERRRITVEKGHIKKTQSTLGLLTRAKRRAKIIGQEFNLSVEDIVVPEFCPVLGIPIMFRTEMGDKVPNDFAPSLDRFDNSKGYTKDNIRVISHKANRLKSNMTLEECVQLYNYMTS